MDKALDNVFKDLSVLVTGHTGFKGSWLSIWLSLLGAKVTGYSLEPPTVPSNYGVSRLEGRVSNVRGDVRDLERLHQTLERCQPRIVFHLAAQPIVLDSYREPKETFDVNVGGTVNLLEAVRSTPTVKALVCITTDKVYENQEWIWGYREIDPLGGHDPYSASKAMAELAIASYRCSFFPAERFNEHRVAIASARSGNVIGGGDWASHRLVPDCARALMKGEPIHLRNPGHVRPWQHVLESLSAYLWLGVKLLQDDGHRFAEAWNFGPFESSRVTAEEVVKKVIQLWGNGAYTSGTTQTEVETGLLRLNWEKASNYLNWHSAYSWGEALAATVDWYREYHRQNARAGSIDMYPLCVAQIKAYTARARELGIAWAK